ncbi:MAG: damage-inducible protein [Gammaproteobacteria bacterium]|nr:MAG: damage-inducible protein [Gammaproteobacteria bacterium]RLA47888.1 MAG: damage-inducible protein [Gammaproteobacteria bacterium]
MDSTVNKLTELASSAANALKRRGDTIAVSESSMGGLVSAALVAVPGASAYFLGGATIYTHESRKQLLGMDEAALKGIRPATEEYALLCARTIHKKLGSTWALAETGATGPDANPYMDPPGTAWIAIVGIAESGPIEKTLRIGTGSNDRETNMWAFTQEALDFLVETIG